MPLPKSASIGARATEVYSKTCEFVLQLISNPCVVESTDPLVENVSSFLPYLRQLITCCACAGIAEDSVTSPACGHCYCYECQFRDPVLKIQCRQCRERRGLVCEEQMRIVVQLYKELVNLVSIHLKDTPLYPLNELVDEVVENKKVSRAILMLPPPSQYRSIPKQITITPKKSPRKPEGTKLMKSGLKKTGKFKKKRKIVLSSKTESTIVKESSDSSITQTTLGDETGPEIATNSQTDSKNIATQSPSLENVKDVASSSRVQAPVLTGASTTTSKSVKVKVSQKRLVYMKVAGSAKHKAIYPCRCGTNAGVARNDRICARRKCGCYVNRVSCTYCKCRGCCNPFNK